MKQCKDIPDTPILEFLSDLLGVWATWFPKVEGGMPSVLDAMPEDTPPKLALAKMKQLVKRGLVDGCGCGCRGDFRITDKGGGLLDK